MSRGYWNVLNYCYLTTYFYLTDLSWRLLHVFLVKDILKDTTKTITKKKMDSNVKSKVHADSKKDGREDEEPIAQKQSKSDQAVRLQTKPKVCSYHLLTPLST